MKTWWGLVRTTTGGFMRVTVQATNAYEAQVMMKSMYGKDLLTEGANLVV